MPGMGMGMRMPGYMMAQTESDDTASAASIQEDLANHWDSINQGKAEWMTESLTHYQRLTKLDSNLIICYV